MWKHKRLLHQRTEDKGNIVLACYVLALTGLLKQFIKAKLKMNTPTFRCELILAKNPPYSCVFFPLHLRIRGSGGLE